MSVTVVIGGQYGSEGKGKTASLLAKAYEHCVVVRCGGANSGHIVCEHKKEYRFRHLPAGLVYGKPGFLAPASVVDLEVLRSEIENYEIPSRLLSVDPFSTVITPAHRVEEIKLTTDISSTGSGTGAATADRVMRRSDCLLIKDVLPNNPWLKPYVRDVRSELNRLADQGVRIILEGTQGFGLSLHHSRKFPKTTSKDTSAAQFVMEAGLSPLLVDEVVMVVRTFPIRVAGVQSGDLPNEITWETLQRESGYPKPVHEYTTVTGKLRRVGRFDLSLVKDACQINRPTKLVVHGLDYINHANLGLRSLNDLTDSAQKFLLELGEQTGTNILYAYTGRDNSSVVELADPLAAGKMGLQEFAITDE